MTGKEDVRTDGLGPIPTIYPAIKNRYVVLNCCGLEAPSAMLAFVLSRAVAALLLRCAPFAMLAVLSIVFFIAGPLDPD